MVKSHSTPAKSDSVLTYLTQEEGGMDGEINRRKSVHETEKKRLYLGMYLCDERGNKSSPETELMSRSVFMWAMCVFVRD